MTIPNNPIRIAIIGYGGSGKISHAAIIQNSSDFQLKAVSDISPERREAARTELGCETCESHHSILENASDYDLVSVVTRSDTHCPIAVECLKAGLHVVVTKPWALNEAEARRMIAAQESSGKRLFPWVPMLWSPEFLKIREIIESGVLGNVFQVRRYINQLWRRHDWQTESRFGGGYLLNWGMHIVQPVLDLVPSPIVRVFGQLQQTINPGDTEDNFMAVMEFENGCRGVAEFTQAIEGLPSFMAQGDRGTLVSDGELIELVEKDPSDSLPPKRTRIAVEGKRYGDEAAIYADIAASLRENKPFAATTEKALYGTIVLDQIRKSHTTRSLISADLNRRLS
ncbi:MAG TPA: hypothetical protein DIV79_03635 [Opitutae bacterium]|nr:hypothetical protein [Opitutaceae bacterium]HCR29089.1 hypothetical protein [Opitutae bacterium]